MPIDFREWLNNLTANEMSFFEVVLGVILAAFLAAIGTVSFFLIKRRFFSTDVPSPNPKSEIVITPTELGPKVKISGDMNPDLVDEALKSFLRNQTAKTGGAGEKSAQGTDQQTAQQAIEDVNELATGSLVDEAEDILVSALKAANENDPDQSLHILKPLREKYQEAKDRANQERDTANRELARLAFVTATLIFANDPVRARPYLEEAATLAPDNFIYLITYGRDLEVTGQSEKAKEIFERALKVATSENNQRNIAWAKDDIGKIQEMQGDLDAASNSYQDGLKIAKELAKGDPSNAERQRDLSVFYNKIGDIQKAQGDLAGALKSYKQDLKIAKELAKEDPSNKQWQRDLSISYEKIGDIQQAQGDLAEALSSYQDGLAIRKDLASQDPRNKKWQRDLSISYDNIGNIQQAQGDLAEALNSYQDGLKIAQKLAKEDPTNKEWQRDLSVSYNKIGDIQQAHGDLEGALSSYQDGLEIRKDLASQDPGNKEWQRDLSVSFNKIGDIQKAQGDLAGALKSYKQDLKIAQDLVSQDSSNMQWQGDLAYSYIAMSFVDKESAKEHLLKAKDILVGPYEKGLLTAQQITNYKAVLGMLDQHK